MGLGVLASADIDALKDKKFWDGVNRAVDRAGLYVLAAVLMMIVGGLGIAGRIDPVTTIVSACVIFGAATGVKFGVDKMGKVSAPIEGGEEKQ